MTELEQFIQKLEGYQRSHPGATQNTVIAMLKAALGCIENVDGYIRGSNPLRTNLIRALTESTLAHLNTLAAEALGTKGEK